VGAVLRHFVAEKGLRRLALAGYSMGGNLVLKLAGDLGGNAPAELKCAVGVSPAIDLGPSADALHEPLNRVYEMKFLRSLLARFRRKATLFPALYDPARAKGVRTLREFDDRITAFYAGFAGASDYYDRAASARVIDRIAIPTLVIHAIDDPFVRLTPTSRDSLLANPQIAYVETAHGGHCAFLAEPDPERKDDGYWAESTLLRFVVANA
jgi:predicted alpha/beta-fold hydrolase